MEPRLLKTRAAGSALRLRAGYGVAIEAGYEAFGDLMRAVGTDRAQMKPLWLYH